MAEVQTVRSTASVNKPDPIVHSEASVNKSSRMHSVRFDTHGRIRDWSVRDILGAAAPFLSAVVSGWYLHPLTIMAYRKSLNCREARFDYDQWDSFKALEKQEHPGRWTFTVGPVGTIEFSVFLAAQELFKPMVESIVGGPVFHKQRYNPAQHDVLDPELFFTSWAEQPEVMWRIVTGVFAAIAARPFTLLRNRMNAQPQLPNGSFKYEGHLQGFNRIMDEEGIAPFARGLIPSIIMLVTCDMIQSYYRSRRNWLMSKITQAFPTDNTHILAIEHALCSGINAFASAAVPMILLRPMEVVLRRLDMQGSGLVSLLGMPQYTDWISCLSSIIQDEGFLSFYSGLDIELMRDIFPLFGVAIISDLVTSYTGPSMPQYKTYRDW